MKLIITEKRIVKLIKVYIKDVLKIPEDVIGVVEPRINYLEYSDCPPELTGYEVEIREED